MEGKDPELGPRFVDVRDVARAHVLAAETAHAQGRYIMVHRDSYQIGQLYAALTKHFPQYKYPDKPYQSKPTHDNSKVCICRVHPIERSDHLRHMQAPQLGRS